jgi:signal peptidase I
MQCPSCGFQNLPGLQQCARCTSRLSFDDVDVIPYRAGDRWARWRRVRLRWQRRTLLTERLGDLWDRVTRRDYWSRAAGSPDEIPTAQRIFCVAVSIVPGLGHVLTRRRLRGGCILGGYLAALIASVVFMSSAWTFFTAVALSLHTYAVTDCIFYKAGYVRRITAVATGLVVFVALALGPYRGATWFLGGFAQVEQLTVDTRSTLLDAGDVLLLTGRWNRPRYAPGDIVSYVISDQGRPHGGGWYIVGGILIDRILAGPGDRVVCKDGRLTVNGKPPPQGRGLLVDVALPGTLDLVVPQGTFFIYPSLVNVQAPRGPQETAMRLRVALVPADRIRGRVRMIISPLSRIHVFQE